MYWGFIRSPVVQGIAVASVLVLSIFFLTSAEKKSVDAPFIPTASQKIVLTDGVERWYTNDERTFSFRLPDEFNAPDIATGDPGITGVSVEKEGQDPLVVLVYHVAPSTSFTEDDIRAQLPDVTITKFQAIALQSVVRAFMFYTNAPEWGSAGIEVWSIYNGRLYRITTSVQNEDLLLFILSNWYFAPPSPQNSR